MTHFAPRWLHISVLVIGLFLLIWSGRAPASASRAVAVNDNHGGYALRTVTLNAVNQPPTPGNDAFTVHDRTQLSDLLANDSDPDGDSIFILSINQPQHGLLDTSTGAQTPVYIPPGGGFVGTDSFTYRVCDPFGLCSDATVTLTVINQSPTSGNDSFTIHDRTQLSDLLANDSDPDGDPIFIQIINQPRYGVLDTSTGAR